VIHRLSYIACDAEVVSDWKLVVAGKDMDQNEVGFVMTP
jgi:hypothetical protein